MTIGIVIENYLPNQMGGIETYLEQLVTTLPKIDNANHYILFIPRRYSNKLAIPPSFKTVHLSLGLIQKLITKLRINALPFNNAKVINKENVDILHFPLQIIQPSGLNGKKLISLMDVQHEYFPEFFSRQERAIRQKAFSSSIDKATHIISISDFTKNTLIEKYKVDSKKITTVHLAATKQLKAHASTLSPARSTRRYFYYPAASWKHKNHELLLNAFASFTLMHPGVKLVFSGIDKNNEDISRQVKALNLENTVVQLGFIPRHRQAQLYRHALGMIFPSLFEGFGIPVVEAMSYGCPVACSNSTSLPEIAGNAALYFNPKSQIEIEKSLTRLATDNKLRATLSRKGYEQAKKFTVEKMAFETIQVYKQVYEER